MSISNEIARISNAKTAIKQAINAKGGTLVNEKLSAYASAIDNLLPEEFGNRVRFIDFDGTILKTMYVADGESATPPALPVHAGLTFKEWNTSLTDIHCHRDIGAVYDTASGCAEFDVRMVVKTGYTVTFNPYLESGTLTIDWGDGTTDTVTGTGKKTVSYTYAEYGDYTVKIKISAGGRWYLPDYFCNSSNYFLVAARVADAYKINGYAFYCNYGLRYCIICDSVTSIGDYAFQECRALQSIVIPPSVTSLAYCCFYYCYALEHIVFPDTLTTIPENCCAYCYTLDCVTFPEGVTTIRNYAFNCCYSLREIGFPEGLTNIEYQVFSECRGLREVKFPSTLTTIGEYAFQYCYGLEKAVLPNSITSLGSYCFSYCHGLQHITIPTGITRIPNGLCCHAYSLEEIMIPQNITYIGDEAFYECWRLRNVNVPSTVTTLRSGCFRYCRSVENYHFHTNTPPSMSSSNVFNDISGSCRIWVPKSADRTVLTAYKTASNWSNYADYIYEEE